MAVKLSLVVAGSRPEGVERGLLAALAAALAAGEVEILIATTRATHTDAAQPGVRVLGFPPGTTVPALRSAGLAAARGEIVALTEDFCVPAPGWIETLLAAHDSRSALAIGGPVRRKTGSRAAWAHTFVEYGRFLAPRSAGPVTDLAGINVSYKRAPLMRRLGTLPTEIREIDFHSRLRAAGETLWHEPMMVMLDHNSRPLSVAMRDLRHHGRLYGGGRVHDAGPAPRLLRGLAAPLVPVLQMLRIAIAAGAAGVTIQFVMAIPHTLVLLCAWAAGECAGSLFGEGDSAGRWV